jgi:hypothetical protein
MYIHDTEFSFGTFMSRRTEKWVLGKGGPEVKEGGLFKDKQMYMGSLCYS